MIDLLTGRIGGGKTYTAAQRIAEALSKGCRVSTNIELNFKALWYYCVAYYGVLIRPWQITYLRARDVAAFYRYVPWGTPAQPTLVVIDEAHLWFGPKSKFSGAVGVSHEGLDFLTQSRKAGVDVVFITQSRSNIDRAFGELATNHLAVRDMTGVNVPLIGSYPFQHILHKQFDMETGELLRWKLVPRKRDVFCLYDSYAFLSQMEEKKRLQRVALKTWKAGKRRARARLTEAGKQSDRVRRAMA